MCQQKKISSIGILILSLFFCNQIIAKDALLDDPTTLSIGCNFPTLEYYTCATEFPVIPDVFKDTVSNDNEDQIYFEYIGGQVNNPCNPVVITASKITNSPATCQDSFMVLLEYIVDDGESRISCTRTLITMRPPLTITASAQDLYISCEKNIDSLFTDWLDNYGYCEYMICFGNILGFTTPADPQINYSCDGTGSVKVKFNLRDGCGNKDTTSAQFFVIDTMPPNITCPADATFSIADFSLLSGIDTLLNCASSFDLCSETTCTNDFTENQILYNCAQAQIIPVVFTASDKCNNTSSCQSTITLVNVDGPMISCPIDLTINCGEPENDSLINEWLVGASALDFYGEPASISINYNNDIHSIPYCDTIFQVNFIAHDICARSQSCNSNIIIRDIHNPVIDSCPSTISLLQNDTDLISQFEDWVSLFEAHDSCSTVTFLNNLDDGFLNYSCDSSRMTNVIFTVKDACGNSNECHTQLEIINDLEGQIICPQALTINCGEEENENLIDAWLLSASATDNYNGTYNVTNNLDKNPLLTYGCYVEKEVQFQFADKCETMHVCHSQVILADTNAPVLTCPNDTVFTGELKIIEEKINTWLDQAVAHDDCRAPLTYNNFNPVDLNNCKELYDIPVTIFAKDSCSLISECYVIASIVTDKSPKINCPSDLTINCGDVANEAVINDWLLGANGIDYLDNALLTANSFSIDQLTSLSCWDSISINFIVEDGCQKTANCQSYIFILDDEQPVISCPDILQLNSTDTDAQILISDWLNSVSGNDNCHAIRFENDIDITDLCLTDSLNYVNFSVFDACQLSNTCTSIIQVNHDPPSLFCPVNLYLECGAADNVNLITNWLSSSIGRDNSNRDIAPDHDFDFASIISGCHSEIPVAFSVQDRCNIPKTCVAHIIIEDNKPPEIECPVDITVDASNSALLDEVSTWLESIDVSDCNNIVVENNLDAGALAFSCDAITEIDVVFEVQDLCNNFSSCISQLKIENDIETHLTCPSPLSLACGDDNQLMILDSWINSATANDNLGNTFTIENNLEIQSELLNLCDETIAVEFEIQDICENPIQCYSVIQMTDESIPEIQCPPSIELVMESVSLSTDIDNWINETIASDNCLLDTVINNLNLGDHLPTCEDTVLIEVQFIAYDACALQSECLSHLRLISENIPSIQCESPLHLQCGDVSNEGLINQWINNFGGLDYFGNALEVINDFEMSQFELLSCDESLDVHFQVTDACNESTSCMSKIILFDDIPPGINCPSDITVNTTSSNNAETLTQWSEDYTTIDNCTDVRLANPLDFDNIDFCEAIQPLEFIFQVEDQCGNINSCIGRVFLNDALPYIACPPPLELECADHNNMSAIESWLSDAMAFDNSGEIIEFNHDFQLNTIPAGCDQTLEVLFVAKDKCDQSVSCQVDINIFDSTSPEITCPAPVQININSPSVNTDIQSWLNTVSSTDLCSSTTIYNDYNTNLNDIACSLSVDVVFKSEDACQNQNNCISQIDFVNIQSVNIQCPENLMLICGDEDILAQINSFIENYQVESNLMYMVYISPETESWDIYCEESFVQNIIFEIEDECGNKSECQTYIDFLPSAKVYIPNAFSPNNDGQNDYFTVFSNESVTHVKIMSIYDRWGNLIFNKSDFPTNTESEGWHGLSQSGGLVDGVYTYYIELSDIFNNNFMYSGTITLFK